MWYDKYMKYVFSAIYTKDEKGYSVLCPELGVASQGIDLTSAESNIREAVELYIEDIPKDELMTYTKVRLEVPQLKTFEIIHA
jgi:predicted RNase H-like HicB family nuclease